MNVELLAQRIVTEITAQETEPVDRAAALNDLALALTRQIPIMLGRVDAESPEAPLANEIAEELVWEAGNLLDLAELRFEQIRRLRRRSALNVER